jgi:threonine dehydrogenase-like Zn-dependent dehydrogenase
MRRIILRKPGHFTETHVPRTFVNCGEVLVRIHRIGVCGSDLHAFAGAHSAFSYPRVIGHELSYEVIAVGENTRRTDDRASTDPAGAMIDPCHERSIALDTPFGLCDGPHQSGVVAAQRVLDGRESHPVWSKNTRPIHHGKQRCSTLMEVRTGRCHYSQRIRGLPAGTILDQNRRWHTRQRTADSSK